MSVDKNTTVKSNKGTKPEVVTNKKKAAKKKTDTEILFPEVTLTLSLGTIIVKPLSFGNLIDISDNIESVVDSLKIRDFKLGLNDNGELALGLEDIATIYVSASKSLLPIMSIVTNIEEEKLRELSVIEGVQLIVTIIQQNGEVLKTFFDLSSTSGAINLKKDEDKESKISK